jgi:ATP adenylyltransferase
MARRTPRRREPPESDAASSTALLWAPWRMAYVKRRPATAPSCIFCFGKIGAAERRRRLVLYAGPIALVMLNRYPYNNGHIMVAPRRHVASPELLAHDELIAVSEIVTRSVQHLRMAYRPDGLNVGINLGRAAGAGVADHMHWHLVPRWEGDVNFMPVIASTRVLPQSLIEAQTLLEPLFKAIDTALS